MRMRAAVRACLLASLFVGAALANDDEEEDDLYRDFQDLTPMKADDSWLDLDTWNPMRVEEFIKHITPEFPDVNLNSETFKEKVVTGHFLKSALWNPLDQKMLDHMQFEDNDAKFLDLGFSTDADEQREQIKRVRARIDKEYMRRRDAKFRKRLEQRKAGELKKAADKLGLEPGQLPTRKKFEKYKVKNLRLLFKSMGLDPTKYGKEIEELREAARELWYKDDDTVSADEAKGEKKKKKKKKEKKAEEEL